MSSNEINQFHKDLAILEIKDIKEKYRTDVRELLTSSLPFSSASLEEIEGLNDNRYAL